MLLALQVGIEVQELAECGEYQSVEVIQAIDSGCGGVLQLRQVGVCLWICHLVHLAKCCYWLWVARMSNGHNQGVNLKSGGSRLSDSDR